MALAYLGRTGRLVRAVTIAAGLILVADTIIPARRSAPEVAQRLASQVLAVQDALNSVSHDERVRELLSPTGTEAEPEAAFRLVAELVRQFPAQLDTLVVVDDSGLPVAWAGARPRVPIRLRSLGARLVATERGVHDTWLWWREAVFEAGRPLGGVLAAVALPDDGMRRPLGVWAGRVAVIRPSQRGGVPVDHTGEPASLA
ncbi:MAG: hypothetical protein GW878_01050, partial [Acidobacteria bacterium]|nr:hypothetical protein [Acidobacteriota bacterium]